MFGFCWVRDKQQQVNLDGGYRCVRCGPCKAGRGGAVASAQGEASGYARTSSELAGAQLRARRALTPIRGSEMCGHPPPFFCVECVGEQTDSSSKHRPQASMVLKGTLFKSTSLLNHRAAHGDLKLFCRPPQSWASGAPRAPCLPRSDTSPTLQYIVVWCSVLYCSVL